jgi:hypothetical protein
MGRRPQGPQAARKTLAKVESLRRALAVRGFPDDARRRLIRALRVYVVDVDVVVTFLELHAGSYRLVRPSGATRSRHNLDALRLASEQFADQLSTLDDDTREAVQPVIAPLQDGLKLLGALIAAAQEASPPAIGPGRRPELVRGWLGRQIRMTLEREGRMNVSSRQGARALSQCLRIILESVGEPVPSDMRPLLNEARRT